MASGQGWDVWGRGGEAGELEHGPQEENRELEVRLTEVRTKVGVSALLRTPSSPPLKDLYHVGP